jgi:hypothetical protein
MDLVLAVSISSITGSIAVGLGVAAAAAVIFFYFLSRLRQQTQDAMDRVNQSNKDLNENLTVQLDLTKSQLAETVTELDHQKQLSSQERTANAALIEQQNKRIEDLREDVTQRAAVDIFRFETLTYLSALAKAAGLKIPIHIELPQPDDSLPGG